MLRRVQVGALAGAELIALVVAPYEDCAVSEAARMRRTVATEASVVLLDGVVEDGDGMRSADGDVVDRDRHDRILRVGPCRLSGAE